MHDIVNPYILTDKDRAIKKRNRTEWFKAHPKCKPTDKDIRRFGLETERTLF